MNVTGSNIQVCFKCPLGYFQSDQKDQRSECDECNSGQHQTQTGMISCDDCLAGKYTEINEAWIECSVCPIGWRTLQQNKNVECSVCSGGQYGVLAAVEGLGGLGSSEGVMGLKPPSCESCPAGWYSVEEKSEEEEVSFLYSFFPIYSLGF